MSATSTAVAPTSPDPRTVELIDTALNKSGGKFSVDTIMHSIRKGLLDRLVTPPAPEVTDGKVAVSPALEGDPVLPPLTVENRTDIERILELWPAALDVSTKRVLTDTEREQLAELWGLAKSLSSLFEALATDYCREVASNDLDYAAVAQGLVDADTPIDKRGHFVVKVAVKAGKSGLRLVRETKGEDRVQIVTAKLKSVLPRRLYEAVTRPPSRERVFDPKLFEAVAAQHPELLLLVAQGASEPATASGAMHLKK